MFTIKSNVWLFWLCAGLISNASPRLTHGPWLTYPDTGAMTIGFTTDCNTGAGVEYRLKNSADEWMCAWDAVAGQLLDTVSYHPVRLTGLQSGAEYEYRIVLLNPSEKRLTDREYWEDERSRKPQLTIIENGAFTFHSFSPDAEPYSFFVTADLQFSTLRRHSILQNYYDGGMKDARFTVLLGDLYYHVDNIEQDILAGIVDKTTALGGCSRPFLFVRGNHEWRGMEASRWCSYFPALNGSTYFSFRCGDVFYIVLDTGEDRAAHALTHHFSGINAVEKEFIQEQKEWLDGVVEMPEFRQAKFRIVLAHAAPYSHPGKYITEVTGRLADGALTGRNPENRIHLWISGHTHFYTRSVPQTNRVYALSAPQKKLYSGEPYVFPVVTVDGPGGDLDTSGVQVLVLNDRLQLEMKYENGEVFDRCEIFPDGSVENFKTGTVVELFDYDIP
ncbi:MAG: FN3 domain-containing metallophosphoesterase family protein [Kiritimatiellales bacterium]